MRKAVANLGKHALIYGMGNLGTRIVAFLLLPLYTAFLTPEDYGILQICNILHTILLIVVQMGLTSSLFKVYYSENDLESKKVVLSSALIFMSASSLVILLPLFLLRSNIAPLLIGGENSEPLFVLILGAVYFESLVSLCLAILRAEEKSKVYALFILSKISIYALLNILFVGGLKRGYLGSREAVFLTMLVAIFVFIPFLKKHIEKRFNWHCVKELLQIGVPLAIGGIASWVLNFTDRYMLKFLLPEEVAMTEVGLYSMGAKFALLVKLFIVTPFMLSWGVLMFSHQHDKNAKLLYSKVLDIFVFTASIVFIIISVFGKDAIFFISVNPDYYDAYKVIPLLSLSYVLLGVFMVFRVGVTLEKKTFFASLANILAAMVNVFMNYLLIPNYGMMGAVFSSLLSFSLMTALMYIFSQKVYPIPYNIPRVFTHILVTVIFVVVVNFFNVALIWKIISVLVFFCFLPAFRLVSYGEIRYFKDFLKKQ